MPNFSFLLVKTKLLFHLVHFVSVFFCKELFSYLGPRNKAFFPKKMAQKGPIMPKFFTILLDRRKFNLSSYFCQFLFAKFFIYLIIPIKMCSKSRKYSFVPQEIVKNGPQNGGLLWPNFPQFFLDKRNFNLSS